MAATIGSLLQVLCHLFAVAASGPFAEHPAAAVSVALLLLVSKSPRFVDFAVAAFFPAVGSTAVAFDKSAAAAWESAEVYPSLLLSFPQPAVCDLSRPQTIARPSWNFR